MREIKFRVIYRGKIVGYERLTSVGWEWMVTELNPIGKENWTPGVFPPDPECKRDQFAGIHDKNGMEIYEGDTHNESYIILWNSEDACFDWRHFSRIDGVGRFEMRIGKENRWCEITGNIHEPTKTK